jgi:hypothetical protein
MGGRRLLVDPIPDRQVSQRSPQPLSCPGVPEEPLFVALQLVALGCPSRVR